jgi:branched-chain amino acid transport system permease protein
MTLFWIAVVAGLGTGAVYGLIALSYNVIFNSTGIFNIAQGDLVAAGVLGSYFCLDVWHLSQGVTLLFVLALVMALSLAEERVAVRPFLSRPGTAGIGWFIATLGFSLILETAGLDIYGEKPIASIPAAFGSTVFHLGPVSVAPQFLTALVLALLAAGALELFYKRTWLGTAMRGVAEDRDASALRGVDVQSISRSAFLVAGLISGLTAFVVAPIVSANVTVGLSLGLKAFVALAVGGFGSLRGSIMGGLLLGVWEQMFDLYVSSSYEVVAGLILLVLVLAVRPAGLFGVRGLREV